MNNRQINLIFLFSLILLSASFSIVLAEKKDKEDKKEKEDYTIEVDPNREYQFVKCPDSNNTYPEGTDCTNIENNIEEVINLDG